MMPEIPTSEESKRMTPALVALGLRTISVRGFAYVALGLTAAGFAYTIYDPNVLRLIGVGMWATFILLSGAVKGGAK